MELFFATMLVSFPLVLFAALVFNYCKNQVRKKSGISGSTCQQSGGAGCSCSAAVQTMIQSADKIR